MLSVSGLLFVHLKHLSVLITMLTIIWLFLVNNLVKTFKLQKVGFVAAQVLSSFP
jgi:ABC-type anion transport system duplicated permease subunit